MKNEPLEPSQSHDSPSVVEARELLAKITPGWRIARNEEEAAWWWTHVVGGIDPACVVIDGEDKAVCATNDDGVPTVGEVEAAHFITSSERLLRALLAEREQAAQSQAAEIESLKAGLMLVRVNYDSVLNHERQMRVAAEATNEQQAAEIVSLRAENERLNAALDVLSKAVSQSEQGKLIAAKEATQRERDAYLRLHADVRRLALSLAMAIEKDCGPAAWSATARQIASSFPAALLSAPAVPDDICHCRKIPCQCSWHDAQCESELTSHGYTPCQCEDRTVSATAVPPKEAQ